MWYPTLPQPIVDQLAQQQVAFAGAWENDQPPDLEAALEAVPEEARAELLRRLLPIEVANRRRRGEQTLLEALRQRLLTRGPWVAPLCEEVWPPEPIVRFTLMVVQGFRAAASWSFTEHVRFLIGKSKGLSLSVPEDDQLSRVHCAIEFTPPYCQVTDNKSTNGTFVNGARIEQPTDLHDGDEIRVARMVLRLSLTAEDDSQTQKVQATLAPLAVQVTPSLPDIPGFVFESEVGRGGMGVVYRARCRDGTCVAVKTVLPMGALSSQAVARFQQEMKILQQIRHPHIVTFLESGVANGLLWFAMEYIEGQSGADLIKLQGRLPLERGLNLGRQLLDALAHAHARGFVHRDVKPHNLLIQTTARGETLKLADFGLARAYRASTISGLTLPNAPGGTFAYMPPEQVQDFHTVQPTADQYAAAATLYHLFTGQPIYELARTPMEWFQRILNEDPLPVRSPPTDLPTRLVQVLNRALARQPEHRYPDVAAFRAALERVGP